jgi:hypothetical protein
LTSAGRRLTLSAKITFAEHLAQSGLLPAQYRQYPANVLWAMEYGDMLGLSTMAAITGVHVIEGKPSASAGLISALVRRAGHKLRVRGNSKTATCTIIRADDPDYVFEVTWTLRSNKDDNPSAEEAQLLGKQVWRNYPASMLKSRAITQCARDACEEAMFGLHYTPEELGAEVDEDGMVIGEIVPDEPPKVNDRRQEGAAAAAETDEEWFGSIQRRILEAASRGECTGLWAEIAAALHGGTCTEADASRLGDMISARADELKNPVPAPAVALTDDDPWLIRIRDIASPEEADDVRTEMGAAFANAAGDDARAVALFTAVDNRVAQIAQAKAAA